MFSKQYVRCILLSSLASLPLLLTSVGAAGAPSQPCSRAVHFDPGDFDHPTRIDNRFLPLVPGTQTTLEGTAMDGNQVLSRRVVFTVTDVTKKIDGVRTVVVWDRDFTDGQLQEEELAFFAQDNAGNVWNLGEYPEVYEDGKFVGAPDTWIAGVKRAEAGIHMLARPRLGKPRYLQGWAPRIDFLDCAKVVARGQNICVPVRCYQNVLVTKETSPLERGGGHQLKYHAPGVGIIKIGAVDDPEAETLELTRRVRLGPEGLALVRAKALRLDRRAYRFSEVYRDTPPAEAPDGISAAALEAAELDSN